VLSAALTLSPVGCDEAEVAEMTVGIGIGCCVVKGSVLELVAVDAIAIIGGRQVSSRLIGAKSTESSNGS